jgi:hypothetical protein
MDLGFNFINQARFYQWIQEYLKKKQPKASQ